MRLVLLLLVLFWNSVGSSADSVVCVPINATQGPANAQSITPINCQIVANKTVIPCYPTYQVNFPQQFPTRVSCTPMEPTTSTSTTTTSTAPTTVTTKASTAQTTTVATTEATTELSGDFVMCLPIRSCSCGENDQGVEVIICFIVDIEIEIRCYPRFIDFIFGQSTPIECLPLDEITESSTTVEESTVAVVPGETVCRPISPCGCGVNDEGVEAIYCVIIEIDLIVACFPEEDFIFNQTAPIKCIVKPQEEEETTAVVAVTEAPVICVPYAEIEGSQENENGVKAIYCQLIGNMTIIICYPVEEFIFFPGPISQRILCVPAIGEPSEAPATTEVATSEAPEVVTCTPVSPCGCGQNDNGVEAIKCLVIDIDIIVICFPVSPHFIFSNQTTIQCIIMEGSTSAPASGEVTSGETSGETSDETSAETEEATVAPVICVPVAVINGSEPNEEGVYPIQCMTLDHILIICFPQSQVIFVGPGEIQQRVFCIPVELEEGTTEVATSEAPEIVTCIPISPCGCGSNDDGVEAVMCIIIDIDVIVICYPLADFVFNQTIIDCVIQEGASTTGTTEVAAEEPEPVICVPYAETDGSQENDEGVKAIYCMLIGNKTIIMCYPVEEFIFFPGPISQRILCIPADQATTSAVTLPSETVSPATDSGEAEDGFVLCIPFAPCDGSSEKSNDSGVEAIYCIIIDIDIMIKCFPKEGDFFFNQTEAIECVPIEEVSATPPAVTPPSEEPVFCIPFSPCDGSSEEYDEENAPIMCWLVDINILIKCRPVDSDWLFNQTSTIECIPCEDTTASSDASDFTEEPIEIVTAGTSEKYVPNVIACRPLGPCGCGLYNEEGTEAIICLILYRNFIIQCFPQTNEFVFNETYLIPCQMITPTMATPEGTAVTELAESTTSESGVVLCIPFAPCASESSGEAAEVIQCLLIDLEIIITCQPMTSDFFFNQTTAIECLRIEENPTTFDTEEPEIGTEGTTEKYVPGLVDCYPRASCECGLVNDEGMEAILCMLPAKYNPIITCFPQTEDFVFNQTDTIKCQWITVTQPTETTPEVQTEEPSEGETEGTSENYVPNVVGCYPLRPCECGLVNDEGMEAIFCLIPSKYYTIYCFPQTEGFVFNLNETIPCQWITVTQPTTTPEVQQQEVDCVPLGPVEDDEPGLIQCQLVSDETVIECYPVAFNGFSTEAPSGSEESSSAASATVGSIKCIPKGVQTTAP